MIWQPDTCGCVFRVTPQCSYEGVVVVCDRHTALAGQPLYDAVVAENRAKNDALNASRRVIDTLAAEVAQANDQALSNYQGWDKLPTPERHAILKMLLGDYIVRNRNKYEG